MCVFEYMSKMCTKTKIEKKTSFSAYVDVATLDDRLLDLKFNSNFLNMGCLFRSVCVCVCVSMPHSWHAHIHMWESRFSDGILLTHYIYIYISDAFVFPFENWNYRSEKHSLFTMHVFHRQNISELYFSRRDDMDAMYVHCFEECVIYATLKR